MALKFLTFQKLTRVNIDLDSGHILVFLSWYFYYICPYRFVLIHRTRSAPTKIIQARVRIKLMNPTYDRMINVFI